jgi:hypothetical protein
VTAIDSGGSVDFWRGSLTSPGWPQAATVGTASTSGSYSAPAIAMDENNNVIITSTLAGRIVSWELVGGYSQWIPDASPGEGYQAATLTMNGHQFEVAAAGPAGTGAWSEAPGSDGWQGPQAVASVSQPSIAYIGQLLVIAARNASGSLWSYSQPGSSPSGAGWLTDEVAPSSGVTYSSPRVVATTAAQYVTAVDSHGGLDFWSSPDTGTWTPQQVAA